MTNTSELKVEMLRNHDNGATISSALHMTESTFSKKLNNLAEFTQEEIYLIKARYNLSSERIDEIFFALEVS